MSVWVWVVTAVFSVFLASGIIWVLGGVLSPVNRPMYNPTPAAGADVATACVLQPEARAYSQDRVTGILLDMPSDPNPYDRFGCVMRQGSGATATYTVIKHVTPKVVQSYCNQLEESYPLSGSRTAEPSGSAQPLWYCKYSGGNRNRVEFIPTVPYAPPIPQSYASRPELVSERLWVTGACQQAYGSRRPKVTAISVAPFGAKNYVCAEEGSITVANATYQKFRGVGPVNLAMLTAYCGSRNPGWFAKAGTVTAPDLYCVSPAVGT